MFFVHLGYAQDEIQINWTDLVIQEREEKYDSIYHYYMETPIFNDTQNKLNNKRVKLRGTLLNYNEIWIFTNPKLIKDHFHSPVVDQSIIVNDCDMPKGLINKAIIENVTISAILTLNLKENIEDLPFLFDDIFSIEIK